MNILVVEDEHKIARAIVSSLEREGYTTDLVFDGDDGYSMATSKPYDLIIIDTDVTGEYDGLGIIKAMRNTKIHSPVLILIKSNEKSARDSLIGSGADDYLEKPFALSELLTKIRNLTRRLPTGAGNILTAGDLELDTRDFTVSRAGQQIRLTGKEFALLEFLLRNKNRPCNKETIVMHVWDYSADVLLNTVEVYIKYLRAKIDDPFDVKLVKTVRGFGYKISDS